MASERGTLLLEPYGKLMAQIIQHPNPAIGKIGFPDDFSDEQIAEAIRKIEGESGASEQAPPTDIRQAEEPGVFTNKDRYPTARSTITGMTPSEAQRRGEEGIGALSQPAATLVRYGVPFIATTAAAVAAPATVLGALTVGAIGFISGSLGEKVAEDLEIYSGDRTETSGREIVASGVANAAPISMVGGPLMRAASNTMSLTGTSELARFITVGKEHYSPKPESFLDASLRYGLPFVLGSLSGLSARTASKTKSAGIIRDELTAKRGGGGVTLSEVRLEYAAKEALRVEAGNKNAIKSLWSISSNIGEEIMKIGDIPDTSGLARDLSSNIGKLKQLQSAAVNARDDAQRLMQASEEAKLNFSEKAPGLEARAKVAALEATKLEVVYHENVQELFGGNLKPFTDIQKGVRNETVQRIVNESDDVMKVHVKEAYENTGLNANSPVLNDEAFYAAVSRAKGRGGVLFDNSIRKDVIEVYKDFHAKRSVDNAISLGDFQRFRGEVYDGLLKKGMSEGAAKRLAGEAYGVLNDAAENTLGSLNPGALPRWKAADALARARFAANESPVIEMIKSGDSDAIFDYITKNGFNVFNREVSSYRHLIASTGNPLDAAAVKLASETGDSFVSMLNDTVNETLFRRNASVASGFREGFVAYDIPGIIKDTEKLAGAGFPISSMDAKGLQSLARIQSSGTVNGFSVDQINKFYGLAAQVGIPKAEAMTIFERHYTQALVTNGYSSSKRSLALANAASKKANLTSQEANVLMAQAQNDPLVVFMSGTGAKLSQDMANNGNFVQRVLSLPSGTAREMMESLERAGRYGDADRLRSAASGTVLQQFEPTANGYLQADIGKISDFFYRKGGEFTDRRNTLRAILGKKGYDNLESIIPRTARGINETRLRLSPPGGRDPLFPVKARAGGPFGAIYASAQEISDFAKNTRYNYLYRRYVDPKYAGAFAQRAGYADKIVGSNPVLSLVMRLADEDDAVFGKGQDGPR